jgi:hypothetical protein
MELATKKVYRAAQRMLLLVITLAGIVAVSELES